MKRIASTVFLAGLMGLPALAVSPVATAAVSVGVGVSGNDFSAGVAISTEPPMLPVYDQPLAPGQGYIWTPGYWAWSPAGYFYWVDGAWVLPPTVGLLWTPGWWGWFDGFYRWHPGYWGPEVGFYGGINYGYGYFGVGYGGGYWMNNRFYYNTAVSHVDVTNIHNTYIDRTVIRNVTVNRVSYNGGRGGIEAQPSAQQRAFANQRRFEATQEQVNHRDAAMRNPAQRYDTNRSRFSGDRPLQPASPSNHGPQPGVTQTQGSGAESRGRQPGADPQATERPQGRNRPEIQRPETQRPGMQPSAPGAPRFERGGAQDAAMPPRGPAERPVTPQSAPRVEQPMNRHGVQQPSSPQFEQRPSRPEAPQPQRFEQRPSRPEAPQPQRFEQRPSRPEAPQPQRFEQRPSRPEAPQPPRFEQRPAPRPEAAPRVESRPAPRVQEPTDRRGGGQERGNDRRRGE
ncbi:hypothetical protein [Castellaniella sp.]|uniref:YXWGXW repeat-containing protein n=1 Tax=Castellaniella sp. TaxID=1955812 RepID=UPI0025BD0CEC|nr:hypothetical protein [Castellaniella sp.]